MDHLHRSLLLFSLAALALGGCATPPLSSVASKFKAVNVSSDVQAPDKYFFRNMTGERARGIGDKFGLVGALVGGAVGASSESKGFDRFEQSAAREKVDIKAVVRSHFVNTLKTSGMIGLSETNPEATFHLEIVSYGVGPVNGEQLGGMIQAKAVLTGRDGKEIWQRSETGGSNTTAPLEDFEKNHRLWPLVMNEAAEKLARQLILYTNEGHR